MPLILRYKPVYVPTPPENLIQMTTAEVVVCDRDGFYQAHRAVNYNSKYDRSKEKTHLLITKLSLRAIDYLRKIKPGSPPEKVLFPWQLLPGEEIGEIISQTEQDSTLAARSEHGFSRFLGVPLVRDHNGFNGKPDVAGYQVKSTIYKSGGLIVQMGELHTAESPIALVVREDMELLYRVVGYLNAGEAWELRRKGIGDPLEGDGDSWLIPQNYLHPFPKKTPPTPPTPPKPTEIKHPAKSQQLTLW